MIPEAAMAVMTCVVLSAGEPPIPLELLLPEAPLMEPCKSEDCPPNLEVVPQAYYCTIIGGIRKCYRK